tara:strand:- start:22 stop:744 length:723 start_codon:yes stop_codon:yes gene_type:complete
MNFKFNKTTYTFEIKLVPAVSTLTALIILLSLCAWQVKRLFWKTDLIQTRIERFESFSRPLDEIKKPSEHEFEKVTLTGEFMNDNEFFMPALSKRGNNGFHILTPFKSVRDEIYIFDRGWVPTARKEKKNRINNMVEGINFVEAVIRTPGRKGKYQPDNDVAGNYWFFVEPSKMSEYSGINFEETYYLEAVNNGPGGSPLGGQTRIYIRNNHLQYAITWFLIACSLIGVFLAASIKKLEK